MTDLAIRDEPHYLATIAEVRVLVERIESIGDAKSLADKARTLQVWAERAKLGQEKLIEVSVSAVRAWEQGQRLQPRPPALSRLAEVTGKPLVWFFTEEVAA